MSIVPVALCIGVLRVRAAPRQRITDYKLAIFGSMILFVVYYLPDGIIGFLKQDCRGRYARSGCGAHAIIREQWRGRRCDYRFQRPAKCRSARFYP